MLRTHGLMNYHRLSFYIILSFFFASTTLAISPQSTDEFCANHRDAKIIQSYLDFSENLIDFKNAGGVLNQGVCWWHSRFQRNLLTIAYFAPQKPAVFNIRHLLEKIRDGKSVVEIPGFKNVEEFSRAFRPQIQKMLNEWQIVEGGLRGGWQRGIQGRIKESAGKLQKMMDELYDYVEIQNKIAYQKLQMKGIVAHSWLVHRVRKTIDGYELSYVDSNSPKEVRIYEYRFGDTSFYIKKYGNFVPYLEFRKENDRLNNVVSNYCN
jgi:hypothetical protein